ncbi:hypothetical protein ABNG02_00390 [Halorubrum ejinorense]|uniref:Uncharacterized protein n=1 Tax=Halorubrum ejinorense TaxID=425309 RepID=A0AAV3SSH6_9EURY
MIDEPLPTPSGNDAESESSDERPSDEQTGDEQQNAEQSNEAQPDAPRPVRGPATGPDRTTDPPPDSGAGGEADDREPEPLAGDGDADESEPLEHRLERIRLWRTVVTLAVVVARLVRSL